MVSQRIGVARLYRSFHRDLPKILKDPEIERLEIPAAVAEMMADPNVLEFWLHRDSSTVFMVKPQENARLVEMAMKQRMTGFQFENTQS